MINKFKKIVIKIGSSSITDEKTKKVRIKWLNSLCKDISALIPQKFKKTCELKKTGLSGLFSASLELTKEGLINISQKKSFDQLLIKAKK